MLDNFTINGAKKKLEKELGEELQMANLKSCNEDGQAVGLQVYIISKLFEIEGFKQKMIQVINNYINPRRNSGHAKTCVAHKCLAAIVMKMVFEDTPLYKAVEMLKADDAKIISKLLEMDGLDRFAIARGYEALGELLPEEKAALEADIYTIINTCFYKEADKFSEEKFTTVHMDTTARQIYHNSERMAESAPKGRSDLLIGRGYIRGRTNTGTSLKQTTVHIDRKPYSAQAVPSKQSDLKCFIGKYEEISSNLDQNSLYVFDGAGCSKEFIQQVQGDRNHFITRLTGQYKAQKELVKAAEEKQVAWQETKKYSQRQDAATYLLKDLERQNIGTEQEPVMVRAVVCTSITEPQEGQIQEYASKKLSLAKKLVREAKRIKYHCWEDALAAKKRLEKQLEEESTCVYKALVVIRTKSMKSKKHGFKANAKLPSDLYYLDVELTSADKEICRKHLSRGQKFVLITTLSVNELSAEGVLGEYKALAEVEQLNHLSKSTSKVYLKKPERIFGAIFIHQFALILKQALQEMIRNGLKAKKKKITQYITQKTDKPTIKVIFEFLGKIHLRVFTYKDRLLQMTYIPKKLREDLLSIFNILEIDALDLYIIV